MVTDTYSITLAIATQIASDSVTTQQFYHFSAGALSVAVLLLSVAVALLFSSLIKR